MMSKKLAVRDRTLGWATKDITDADPIFQKLYERQSDLLIPIRMTYKNLNHLYHWW
jgi:hypothetical protein